MTARVALGKPASYGDFVLERRIQLLDAMGSFRGHRLLDVGSGNGFPAVPLLLARPELKGVLLEPRERRWAFLKEAIRELAIDAEVRRERLSEHRGSHDIMSVRALAFATWGPEAARAVRPGGTVVYWAGHDPDERPILAGFEPVLTSPLPDPRRGVLAVWRRCST